MTGLILLALLQTAALPAADTLLAVPTVVPDTVVVQIDTAAAPAAASAAADTSGLDIRADTGEAVETIQGLVSGFFAALPKVGIAIVVFLLFWLIAKGVRSLVQRVTPGPTDSSIGVVLGRLAYAGLLVLGVFVALVVVIPSLKFSSIIAGLGIGGVAIGFAFQDIFQNLLAGILLLLRQPFREGDEITSGEYTGTVEAIETRATFIKTYDGRRIIVPNSQIYSQPVSVITAYHLLRSEYDVGIGYGDDIAEAKRIALETVQGVEGVLADPAPDVLTWDLAGSSVNLRVRWWTDPTRKNVVVRDWVLTGVKEALLAAGIDLPFPTTQVLVHDQTEATDGDRRRPTATDGASAKAGRPATPSPPRTRSPRRSRGGARIRTAAAGARPRTPRRARHAEPARRARPASGRTGQAIRRSSTDAARRSGSTAGATGGV